MPLLDEKTKVEIKNRTNVALPDHFVMIRRGTARLTVNPPNLRVRGGSDQTQRDKVAALNYWQWDRGQMQRVFRQNVHQCKAFGWSVNKTYCDKTTVTRKLFRWTQDLTREQLLTLKKASPDDIQGEIQEKGDQLSAQEIQQAMGQFGDKVQTDIPTRKYEGPMGARIFIGDCFPEPGFRVLNTSSYFIEYSERDIRWLKYWSKQKTLNPYTNQEQPVFDQQACQDLIDRGGRSLTYQRDMDLRRQLRLAINRSDPRTNFDPRLRGPRYSILERHTHDDSGYIMIDFCGDESVHLGRMWYPWQTYGKYIYTELVLIPDFLGGIGQSTPRISRFLMQLRNTRMNQTTDYINNVLRPGYTVLDTADIADEQFIRTAWGNALKVQSHDDIKPMQQHQLPPAGWEDQAQLKNEMQQVDPQTTDFSPGSSENPAAGKFATTAMLQQKSSDVIVADELAQIDLFLTDDLELRMAMNQQAMQDSVDIPQGIDQRIDALSARMQDGGVANIRVDQMDIQDDLQVVPETGSTLAADDEYKRAAVERGYQYAMQAPMLWNVRKFAEVLAQTIPGISPADAILPPPTSPPPPPPPKVNVSIQIKWDDLPEDVQAALLQSEGLPTTDTEAKGHLEGIQTLSDAADAAANLDSSAEGEPQQTGKTGSNNG